MEAEYLGDGVYVCLEGDMLKLMTGSHLTPDNVIYLERAVYAALVAYVARLGPEVNP